MTPTYQIWMRGHFLEPRNRPKNVLKWKFAETSVLNFFSDFSALENAHAAIIVMWASIFDGQKFKELSLNPTKVISVPLDGHGH